MPSNFTLGFAGRSKASTEVPALAGKALETKDQDATASWAEVTFTNIGNLPAGRRGVLCHIVSTTAVRYAVATSLPGVGEVGSLLLANTDRIITMDAGQKLYIKS